MPNRAHPRPTASPAVIYADGDGQQYLVPAYEFTMSDETVWSVLALAEESLMTAPAHGGLYGWR